MAWWVKSTLEMGIQNGVPTGILADVLLNWFCANVPRKAAENGLST